MGDNIKKQDVEVYLRSVLQSAPGGVPLRNLQREFQLLVGNEIPFKKFGFRSLEEYLQQIPNIAALSKTRNGEIMVLPIADEATAHIQSLVERQRNSRKSRVKLKGPVRQPARFQGRPKPSTTAAYREVTFNRNVPPLSYGRRSATNKATNARSSYANSVPTLSIKFGTNFDIPPRFKKKLDINQGMTPFEPASSPPGMVNGPNEGKPVNSFVEPVAYPPTVRMESNLTDNAVVIKSVKSPDKRPVEKVKTSKKKLEDYVAAHKLGQVDFKVISIRYKEERIVKYIGKVKINETSYSTYPEEFSSMSEAEEEVSKKALAAIIPDREEKPICGLIEDDIHLMISQVNEILESYSTGLFHTQLPIEYEKRHGVALPPDWLKLLCLHTSCIRFENVDTNRVILYPRKVSIKDDSGSVKSESSVSSIPQSSLSDSSQIPGPLLLPDSQYLDVFVTYVNSPIDVVVRLVGEDYSEKYEEMATSMDLFYMNHTTPLEDVIVIGGLYAAKVDDSWHRVEVLSVNSQKVQCLFFDHGDTDFLDPEQLYTLEQQFLQLPYQAIHCQLTGLEPYADSTTALLLLMEMIIGKTLVAQITSRDEILSLILFDTSSSEDVNINDQLLEKLGKEEATLSLPTVGNIIEVQLSNVTASGVIFVQPIGHSFNFLENLIADLQEKCEYQQPITDFDENNLYIAKFSEDNNWYRAMILNINDSEVEVKFVDYGNTDKIPITNIRNLEPLNEILTRLPYQALECKLHSLPPSDDLEWSPKVTDRVLQLTENNQVLLLKVLKEETDESLPEVELFKRIQPSNELVSINQTLALQRELFTKKKRDDTNNNELKSLMKKSFPSSAVGSSSDDWPDQSLSCPIKMPEIAEIGDYMDLHILMAANPFNFWTQPWRDGFKLDVLMEKMSKFYNSEDGIAPLELNQVHAGDIVACRNGNDSFWYRAQITNVLSDKMVSVYFIDYADNKVLSIKDIQLLHSEFRHLPYQALKCKLAGVAPSNGDWTVEDCIYFQGLVVERQFVALITDKIIDSDESVLLTVELIDTSKPGVDIYIHKILIQEKRAVAI